MDTPVSSLYGPGAIVCWLCTVLAVVFSWLFNGSSRRYDTITGDLVASWLLPSIATVHFTYEISHATKTKDWKASPSLDATFAICMDFVTPGILLCSLSYFSCHTKRIVFTGLVMVVCFGISIAGAVCSLQSFAEGADRSQSIPRMNNGNAGLSSIITSCFVLLVMGKSLVHGDALPRHPAACINIHALIHTLVLTLFALYETCIFYCRVNPLLRKLWNFAKI